MSKIKIKSQFKHGMFETFGGQVDYIVGKLESWLNTSKKMPDEPYSKERLSQMTDEELNQLFEIISQEYYETDPVDIYPLLNDTYNAICEERKSRAN